MATDQGVGSSNLLTHGIRGIAVAVPFVVFAFSMSAQAGTGKRWMVRADGHGELGMDRYELIAPCHFGLEAVLKAEITALGLEIVKVEDGRVTFCGDASAVARANI